MGKGCDLGHLEAGDVLVNDAGEHEYGDGKRNRADCFVAEHVFARFWIVVLHYSMSLKRGRTIPVPRGKDEAKKGGNRNQTAPAF
jgi:hypothetical protein